MTRKSKDDQAVEALFARYIDAWNARDYACIANDVYRTPGYVFDAAATSILATPDEIVGLLAGLRADLDAAGFSHSLLDHVSTCDLGDGLMFATFHYRRIFRTEAGGEKDDLLASAYIVRRYPDGWHMVAHVFQAIPSEFSCAPRKL